MPKEARPRNQLVLTAEEVEVRRPILLAGIAQYNDGYFFESHETWEDLWYPSPWPLRDFLQGVIQIAAAFVHLKRHQFPGTVRLLDAALERLEPFPPDYQGLDVDRLRTEARRARDELAALGPESFEEWGHGGIPKIHLLAGDA